ncbi:MAG TPA: TIGR01777 family oxidoreductase [Acidobacteriota bacterium]|nr:TIGR01777 family oxidoreductase [Acidobacteriota bacterium]
MKIVVTGATGMIGKPLCRRLLDDGHELIILSRSAAKTAEIFPDSEIISWDAVSEPPPARLLQGAEAAVHLAGESIAERWTKQRKEAIHDSRVFGTRNLVHGLLACEPKPRLLLSASAVGFYGNTQDETVDESSPAGKGFLAGVGVRWEEEALPAAEAGMRLVLLRSGIVLDASGGALGKMLTPFKLGLGGRLGNGRQYMSWIHLEDQVRAILHCFNKEEVHGPVNLVAPNPVSNKEFTRTLAKVLRRPAFLPAPAFILRLVLGEMAEQMLLQGQRVEPGVLQRTGFEFQHPRLEKALRDLL